MAQLKSTIVAGYLSVSNNLNVGGDILTASNLDMITGILFSDSAPTIKTRYLEIPTTSKGSTIGRGTAGQVLMTNGSTGSGPSDGNIYWGTLPSNTYSADGTAITLGSDNKFSHATSAGYKHIPSGGSSGQYLKYSASGTATWAAVPTYSADGTAITLGSDNKFSHATSAGYKHIPSGGSSGQYLKYSASGTATWATLPTNTASAAGIVSAPGANVANKVWKTGSDGTPAWRDDANTTYSAATASKAGLIFVKYDQTNNTLHIGTSALS